VLTGDGLLRRDCHAQEVLVKLIVETTEDEYGTAWFTATVNGKSWISVDLNFALSVPDLMREAYEAGKRGEPFDIEKRNDPERVD
jgi:hypothetical protein